MTPERWQQISRIFKSAISLNGEARSAYVAGQCGIDESLRAEVEKLIESHQQADADEFIGGVAAEAGAALLIDDDEIAETRRTLNQDQQLGSYLILNNLGAGGMGEVYLARDSRLGRTVALKLLSQDVASDKRRMRRFRQEAKVASSLNQPNILTIFEFGEVDGLTFLATEYIDGETLRDRLRAKRLKLGEILDIAIQVLAALDAAHEARIVHRDIKPENVMIRRRDGVVKVLDFGLAKVTERDPATLTAPGSDLEAATEFKTAPGLIMGTINYMSPEQAQGHVVNEGTDIWSTGVMLYEMVTGAMPFRGATSSHTIVQILEKNPAPLSDVTKENVPDELERIVSKAIAKNPDERYQTAKDMLIDLRNLKKQLDIKAEIERTSSPRMRRLGAAAAESDRSQQKKRVLMAALIVMAVVTAAILGINVWRSSRSRTSTVVTSPVPVPERMFTYWIEVQRFRDGRPFEKPLTMPGEIIFEEDYQIRVNVRSPQAGYLYIFNEGPPGQATELNVAFPSPTANNGSPFLPADTVVQIPQDSWLRFDNQQGTEKLWLVFAEDAIPEFQGVEQFATPKTQGAIADPVQNSAVINFLKAHSSPQPKHERDGERTTVKAASKFLVYAIKLEHL